MEFDSLKNENNIEIRKKAIEKEITRDKKEAFVLFGKGTSMWPTLLEKDTLYFKKKISSDKLQVGDIVAYISKNEKIICHRIVKTEKDYLWTIGDVNYLSFIPGIENCEKVPSERVFGILVFAKRKNKILKTFPNNNKAANFSVKIKFKLMNWFIKTGYHRAYFIRNIFSPPLMITLNKKVYARNIKKINLENYNFIETRLEDSKIKLEIYSKEQHVNTIYYEVEQNVAKIYKMSVKMRNFGNGTEFMGLKYLENKGFAVVFDLNLKSSVYKYFARGLQTLNK